MNPSQLVWLTFCFSWLYEDTFKGFFSIVNWPCRFCPPALLSSNWMGNNFTEQQQNEDKKWNFFLETIPFYILDKSLFFVPFYPPFAERKWSELFQTGNPFLRFKCLLTKVYHCQVELHFKPFVLKLLKLNNFLLFKYLLITVYHYQVGVHVKPLNHQKCV